jgi:hypothetical protein
MQKIFSIALSALLRHWQLALLLLAALTLTIALLHPKLNLARGSFNNIFILDISPYRALNSPNNQYARH